MVRWKLVVKVPAAIRLVAKIVTGGFIKKMQHSQSKLDTTWICTVFGTCRFFAQLVKEVLANLNIDCIT